MLSRAQIQDKKPIPVRYVCPITQQIVLDPVMAKDGRTYEREAISTWLETHNTSPMTNAVLKNNKLIENFELPKFLQLVAEGEQDEVRAMLQQNPALALHAGNVTDLSGRSFNNITGFQYAVWALDWHMWKMILRNYLPEDAAREQIKGMETGSWVREHGKSASWQNLIDALDTFIELCNKGQWGAADKQWCGAVGNAQKLLPVHVVNEYCHPTRSFDPCPNFNDATALPRSRKTNVGDWFSAPYNGACLGYNCFAFYRAAEPGARGWERARAVRIDVLRGAVGRGTPDARGSLYTTETAVGTLLKARTQQRDQLFHDLAPKPSIRPGL